MPDDNSDRDCTTQETDIYTHRRNSKLSAIRQRFKSHKRERGRGNDRGKERKMIED